MSDAIEAQFPGLCPVCDERIEEGDRIVNQDGEWVHADCADE